MRNIILKFDEKSVNDLYHRDNEIDENIKIKRKIRFLRFYI